MTELMARRRRATDALRHAGTAQERHPRRLRDPGAADGRQPLPRRRARSTSANWSAAAARSSATEVFDEQAERIEGRLAKDPTGRALLLALTRARINAGNAQANRPAKPAAPTVTAEAGDDFDAALGSLEPLPEAGRRRTEPGGRPAGRGHLLQAGGTGSASLAEIAVERRHRRRRRSRSPPKQQPNLGSLSTLAIYQYFDGELRRRRQGDEAGGGQALLESRSQKRRKTAGRIPQTRQAVRKAAASSSPKSKSRPGKEQLQNPFGLAAARRGG